MQHIRKPTRPSREKVLIVSHADGYLEVFGPKHITAKIVRCPAAFNPEMEVLAEDYLELSLPPVWSSLFYPGFCRASAMLRPLLPSTILDAKLVRGLIRSLSKIGEAAA